MELFNSDEENDEVSLHIFQVCTYGTAQFKLEIYTWFFGQVSRATRKLHMSKSLKYTFTCVSL